jgi:2-polyprenyl-3-methyl-5-hydroxy-6-metoxy-1,4-benzoquinol methylase
MGERPAPQLRCPFTVVDGIVHVANGAGAAEDYPPEIYSIVAEAEPKHFWFGARNDIILDVLRRQAGALAGRQVIDVGCGTGFVLQALEAAGVGAWGIDMHLAALAIARGRVRGPLLWSQAEELPFGGDFDGATLCDVIEHAADDAAVVAEAARVVRPGGFVLVTVPAGPRLWTNYDRVIGHKRRYTRAMLEAVFARVGLRKDVVQYFNCLPAIAQCVQRWLAGADIDGVDPVTVVARTLAVPPAPINAALRRYVPLEARIGRFRWMSGASLIGIARK